ncbi:MULTISPECIES: Dam family site-specific DNA-(adenine-N6)-methyltransferase [Staphylococcaceae]|nr:MULTISPECIES: Dam family site-specific DNA-(adenine-N6)-methyltransferase [Staphylococcaceae]MCG7337720.1 Dam family site-specific DNA-(adenine-N6)-methyltransferase [Staphylococcus sp. ACRSN]MDG0822718.1 Dam family site-specific DNA-(adenine-N6)-methyltransferase [Staphylococcus equorum]WIL69726.1 Dam family site-specific DNA-(adenine-N6)-methyltransferase [Staphylococcus cohnii]
MLKSPLNYVGGKYKLLPQIIPLFPNEIDLFVDLFSGGANVGINVEAKKYWFNDMNYKINEMFRFFSTQDPDELIYNIDEIITNWNLSKTNQEAFLAFRNYYNSNPSPINLYVLVAYSYNYQIRFNNSMKFNNPFGKNRSQFTNNMRSNLYKFVKRLNEIKPLFTDYLFEHLNLSDLKPNDFVYLDPPYLITRASYNDGNRGFTNWNENQELKMYNLLNQLTSNKVRWAMSNVLENKEKQHTLLENFIKNKSVAVHVLNYNYNNSSYNSKGVGSKEVLITNYDVSNGNILKY